MKTLIQHFPASACAIAAALLVAACGGGDASPPPGSTALAGFVVDGYVVGANVICDVNEDGVRSTNETAVVTDSSGFFRFSGGCGAPLVATGGTHFGGVPFTTKLMAPAGSSVITPLTTLLALGIKEAELNTALGLPPSTDLRNTDPARMSSGVLVNSTLYKRTLALQQVALQLTETFVSLAPGAGAAERPAIYAQVASSIATSLGSGDVLITGTDVDAAVLTKLVKAAALRVAGSGQLSSEVRNGAAALNADTLAQVLAGGLNVQTDALASATDTSLIALATGLQVSPLIKTLVGANVATLSAPPSPASASLTETLSAQAVAALSGTAPPAPPATPAPPPASPPASPPGADTVLLNFDDLLPLSANGGEGGEGSGLVTAPAGGGSGQAYSVLRSGGQAWALAVIETTLPLTNERKTLTARVFSPAAGVPMIIKLEGAGGINSGEVQANEAVVAGWQTLSWTFNTLGAYTKMVLLPNLGTVDAPPGKSYVFDDFKLKAAAAGSGTGGSGGSGGGATNSLPITFDAAGVTYTLTSFEGAVGDSTAADPAGGTNRVGKVTRSPGGPWYGGTTVSTGANNSIAKIPFASGATAMSMRFYSPGPGVVVRMKVENAQDAGITVETDATTTATGWERLTFNFSNPGLAPPVTGGPTAALNLAQTYNKVTVFFNVAAPSGAWGGTYYFDDIAFVAP